MQLFSNYQRKLDFHCCQCLRSVCMLVFYTSSMCTRKFMNMVLTLFKLWGCYTLYLNKMKTLAEFPLKLLNSDCFEIKGLQTIFRKFKAIEMSHLFSNALFFSEYISALVHWSSKIVGLYVIDSLNSFHPLLLTPIRAPGRYDFLLLVSPKY